MTEKIRPFVKWAGGKGSLIPQLNKFYPYDLKNRVIGRYIEPFVGGGAVLIDILQKYNIKEAFAFDINKDLINSYNVIKNNVDELITILKEIETQYLKLEKEGRKKYFYIVREKYNNYTIEENETKIQRAAQFVFLNRTCFNGLYRVNKSGKFNVPIGSYKNPTICDEQNLKNLSKLIQNVQFECGDYKNSIKYVTKNTFVYFDPPYRPLNITSGFTSYTKEDFNDDDQKELAKLYKMLDGRNAKLMLSNSNPKNINKEDNFFDNLYKGFNINEIYSNRMINSKADGRGKISEIVVTNYNNTYSKEMENEMERIKKFEDGSFLEYDDGRFDKWGVYYTDSNGNRKAPKDTDYFKDLYNFSKKYGNERIYSDYVRIYNKTNKYIEEETISYIEQIAKGYELLDRMEIEKMFMILYMGMIAEENKERTKLGKRIKRLGVHTLLVENRPIKESATFMTGKRWQLLDKLCKERGF